MDLSYAQNLKDCLLSLAFTDRPRDLYRYRRRASDRDKCHSGSTSAGWRGIVSSHSPNLGRCMSGCGHAISWFAAWSDAPCGEIDFYAVERLHGLSTTVQHLANKAKALGVEYQTIRMPVTTLADLCERHEVGSVDFLKIDVEGGEGDVLLGGDWKRFRPKVIVPKR